MKKINDFVGKEKIPGMQKVFIVTKLCIFFLFASTLSVLAGKGFSQEKMLNLEMGKATVREVLSEIEEQSGCYFMYSSEYIDINREISVNVENKKLDTVLDLLFSGTNVDYTIKDKIIVLSVSEPGTKVVSQNTAVTGKVTDTNGVPLLGVTIVIKGTTRGVVTSPDGTYTISDVSGDAILLFSFIGMKTEEVHVAGQRVINVVLEEDAIGIDEVVAIGYGTAKRKDITGSVVRADLTKLRESPNISLGQALQGTIPGLNVGAVSEAGKDPSISIRGRNSISGETAPLIVLDGIIYRGSLVDINPNDIESIDVLKDASAAAIYGSQASNGVMLITSKQVKAMRKPVIEYAGTYTLQESSNKKMRPMKREGFLQLVADSFLEESRTGTDLLQPNSSWDVTKHLIDANAVNGYLDEVDTDWWKLGTNRSPYIQMHNLSVRGRSELSNYFLSFGYTDQKNLVANDTYKRYNIRLNLDTKITDWMKVGAQSFFTMSDWSGVAALDATADLLPIVPEKDAATGEYITYPYRGTLNPSLERQQDNLDKRYNLFGNFYADVDIPFIKGLNYRMNFSQNLIMDKKFNFNPWGADLAGSGSKENASQYSWTVDNILTYKRQFDIHEVNATLVYGAERRKWEQTVASGEDFANPGLGYNFLGAATASRQSVSSDAWEESSLYTMFRILYTYKDRYSFTGTIRRDGFSGFGKNNKFALFPSAAAAWRLSEEDFMEGSREWLDILKLRLSYGMNGNRTIKRYQTLARMASNDAYLYGDGAPAEKGFYLETMFNDNLKWETTRSLNTGLEFSLWNSRLYGNMEYYRSNTFDLLYNISIPSINIPLFSDGVPLSSIPANIGKLANHGVELSLTGVPVQTGDFNWQVTFNFSRNRNKVVSILGTDNDGDGKEDDLVADKIFIGHPYGVNYDFVQDGMWQLADRDAGTIPTGFYYGTYKVKDLSGEGEYTADKDRAILSYTDPSYRFSVETVLRYKDWELKAFVNSIQGGKKYYYGQPAKGMRNPDNIYKNNIFKWDYWTPENPNARYRQPGLASPILGDFYHPYVQRSFVRLQNLTLAYRVPSDLLKRAGINNFKVYVTGTNLFTITDWDGWDPETGIGLGGGYPLMKTYSVGVNFDF